MFGPPVLADPLAPHRPDRYDDADEAPAPVAASHLAWQGDLFGLADPVVDASFPGLVRRWLDAKCWVDHVPRWLGGAEHVFAELVARTDWEQPPVVMYGRILATPRLVSTWLEGDGPPSLDVLEDARALLSWRYDRHFDSIGLNLYRNGTDSVAWHGDRLSAQAALPVVAIVSVGAPRPFLLRPKGGGPSVGYLLGQGDLLVMGGDTQQSWEHTVPKVAAAGPRISITYRHGEPDPGQAYRPLHSRANSLSPGPAGGGLASPQHPAAGHPSGRVSPQHPSILGRAARGWS